MSKPTPEFMRLLADIYAAYGQKLPDAPVISAWWSALSAFPQKTIHQAFSAYSLERPDFAPAPNGIAARCKLLDGRPDENEAWATSIRAMNEFATIVWTEEMATAWYLARNLDHDEIACRMAFKEAYKRLVAEARAMGVPVKWTVSQGDDGRLRLAAVQEAVRLGRLPNDAVATLQIACNEVPEAEVYPEGLKKVKEMLASLEDPNEKAERIRLERLAQFQADEEAEKRRIDALAKSHPDYKP